MIKMTKTEYQLQQDQQKMIEKFSRLANGDPVKLVESIYRVRDNKGRLKDYIMTEPHKILMRSGYLGDRTALHRIINKGRQLGYSVYQAVEASMIATRYPNTHQYYIATKEAQAKSWLRKVERISKDTRLWVDGSRIIDIDTIHSSLLEKVFHSAPTELQKEGQEAYITGLAASPAGVQGETAISVILDEFAWMIQRKNQQQDIYEAVKYFVSQGGQLTIQSTPVVTSDTFWRMYKDAARLKFTAFTFPTIENWRKLDLTKDLTKQDCHIPYPWVDINLLEQARRNDLAFFKQMNLGVPADVMFRFLNPDVLHSRVISEEEWTGRQGDIYGISIDVAQDRDITAITVGKKVNDIVKEVYIEESQNDYTIQAKQVEKVVKAFPNSRFINIDTTGGHGRALYDILKYKVPIQLNKIEFASTIAVPGFDRKEKLPNMMAVEFNNSLINNKYHLIEHSQALQHCLNVEKTVTSNGSVRYSGKSNGRDDHFWSKAMLNWGFLNLNGTRSFVAYSKKIPNKTNHRFNRPQQSRSGFLTF